MTVKTQKTHSTPHMVNKLYSKIAIALIVASFLLILAIFYLAFSHATITLSPITTPVNTSFEMQVAQDTSSDDVLNGKMIEKIFTEKKDFQTQPSAVVTGPATGKIIVTSKYSQSQTLIKTTRFESNNGLIYRALDKVVIPPYGTIEVPVQADESGEKYLLDASTFTIPGLNPTLRALFESKNTDKFQAPSKQVKMVTQSDIDNASNEMKNIILEKAYKEILVDTKPGEEILKSDVAIEIIKATPNIALGAEAETFSLEVEAKVAAIVFNKQVLLEVATHRLQADTASNLELISIDNSSFQYSTSNYNSAQKVATIKVGVSGKAVSRSTNSIFDKTTLKGKSQTQVIEYFQSFPDIEKVEVEFSPSWLPIVPRLEDHITIKLLEKEVGIVSPQK